MPVESPECPVCEESHPFVEGFLELGSGPEAPAESVPVWLSVCEARDVPALVAVAYGRN